MSGILNESGGNTNLQDAIAGGYINLAHGEEIVFTKRRRVVVSQDGYVYWAKTGQQVKVPCSLHIAVDRVQDEDQTIGQNVVILTTQVPLTAFNDLEPDEMWVGNGVGAASGDPIDIAFSRRGPFYQASGTFYYTGFAVFPALKAQFIDTPANLPKGPIVSNSLPIWLAYPNNPYRIFPSFLVGENVEPPYIVVHIEPEGTMPLQAFPTFTWPGTTAGTGAAPLHDLPSQQLMRDMVRLTLYGFNNEQAIQYLVGLEQYSYNTDDFGFTNSPAIRDEKRTQVEIAAIAMKKTIEIQASYYQSTSDAIARRLILSAGFSSITT